MTTHRRYGPHHRVDPSVKPNRGVHPGVPPGVIGDREIARKIATGEPPYEIKTGSGPDDPDG